MILWEVSCSPDTGLCLDRSKWSSTASRSTHTALGCCSIYTALGLGSGFYCKPFYTQLWDAVGEYRRGYEKIVDVATEALLLLRLLFSQRVLMLKTSVQSTRGDQQRKGTNMLKTRVRSARGERQRGIMYRMCDRQRAQQDPSSPAVRPSRQSII